MSDYHAMAYVAAIIAILVAWHYYSRAEEEKRYVKAFEQRWMDAAKDAEEYRDQAYQKASALFDEFKAKEIAALSSKINGEVLLKYSREFEHWKSQWEITIREDAIKRSKSTLHGKASEQIAPFYSKFPFDTRDARFIGSPVDFIIFSGAANEDQVTIYFMEVKTGKSTMSNKQKLIREAVLLKRVVWREWNPDN